MVRLRTAELRETQLELQRNQSQLEATGKRVKELEASVEATRPQLAAHARALYKLGELSYLRLLLSVDRPSDFFRGYRFVSALARRDNERMAGFRADLQSLADTRAELERRTREGAALRTQLEGSAPRPRGRAPAEDGSPHLHRREEGDARRLRGGAGAGRKASSAGSSRASATGT